MAVKAAPRNTAVARKVSRLSRAAAEPEQEAGPEQRLRAVADEPAQHHARRYAALELDRQVRRKHRGDHHRPRAAPGDHQAAEQDGVRRPQHGHRYRGQRQRKPQPGAEVVTECNDERRCRPGS